MSSSSSQDGDDFGGPPGYQAKANVDGNRNGNNSWGYGQEDFEDVFYGDLDINEFFGNDEDDELIAQVNKNMDELFGHDDDDDGLNNANNGDNNSIVANNNDLADAGNGGTVSPAVLSESPDPAMNGVDSNVDINSNNAVEVDIPLMQASMQMTDDRLSNSTSSGEGPMTILPRSAIRPGFGTSAMGTAFPGNGMGFGAYRALPAIDNSAADGPVGSNATMSSPAAEIPGPVEPQGIPTMDNSATAYAMTGNKVIDDTVIPHNCNNNNSATAYSLTGNNVMDRTVTMTINNNGSTIVSLWEGNPFMDNSGTAYSLNGNNVIDNIVIPYEHYTNMNNGVAPAHQFNVNAYPSAAIMGNSAPAYNAQHMPSVGNNHQFNYNPAPVYNAQPNPHPVADNDQFNYVDLYQYQVAQQQQFPAQQQMVSYAPPGPPDPADIPLEEDGDWVEAHNQQFDGWHQQVHIAEQQRHAAEVAGAFPPQLNPTNALAPAPAPAPAPTPAPANPVISFGMPSMGPAPAPFVFQQPFNASDYHHPIGNVAPGNNNVNISPIPRPQLLPRAFDNPNRPLPPHKIFPFGKLPAEIQLMIMREAWHVDPLPCPGLMATNYRTYPPVSSYQQQLVFYSNARHLRRQLAGLFKLGSISSSFRKVAYPEFFKHTQLYLRHDPSWHWTYSSGTFGSADLTRTMSLLWENEMLRSLLETHVEHVAWHLGPVYDSASGDKRKVEQCLTWLRNCKKVKSLEIIIGMRTAHVEPRHMDHLFAKTGKIYGPNSGDGSGEVGIPWTVFRSHRRMQKLFRALRVWRTEGRLKHVVFTVEDFVNECVWQKHQGKTIDLAGRLERSKWWVKFKETTLEALLGPAPRKGDPEEEEVPNQQRLYIKFHQHLGAINPNWHTTDKLYRSIK